MLYSDRKKRRNLDWWKQIKQKKIKQTCGQSWNKQIWNNRPIKPLISFQIKVGFEVSNFVNHLLSECVLMV